MTNPSQRQTIKTLTSEEPQLEINYKGNTRILKLTDPQYILGRGTERIPPAPEGFPLPDDWGVVSRVQACVKKVEKDYYIYDGDGQERRSANGLFISNKIITPQEGHKLQHGDKITVGQNPRQWVTITYIDPTQVYTATIPLQGSISLKNRSVMLGRDGSATLQLDSPMVSRRHATIDNDAQGRYILQDHSANGIFVNDQKVNDSVILNDGDSIRIGPYTFVLEGDDLVLADQGNHIRIDAQNIVREVKHRKSLNRLLNHISLVIEPGQLVALVGGSGSGKSTLMKTLLGIDPVTEGSVFLNGDDLRKYFNIYRTLIGYVPQQDIVHNNLTVSEVLHYAAKLRLPTDIEINSIIDRTLEQTELSLHKDKLVKNLSGGQLKRVSIGVELLADPKLFFLDEPTSGLDPGLDKKMMQLLRRLADEGRTIILVTHATNYINLCDRVVFLGTGGNLCYYGPPDKAFEFFGIQDRDLADVYIKLETQEAVIEEAEKFQQSAYKKEYIDDHLSQSNQKNHLLPQQVRQPFLRQLWVLMQRYSTMLIRDRANLALSLLTAPLGISLMTIAVPKGQTPFDGITDSDLAGLSVRILFVFTCAGIWVGLASSLQEIVKESAIYLRERLVNLGLFAYLGSKVLTLGGLAVIQSFIMTVVILICFKHPDPIGQTQLIPWPLSVFITTFLTLIAAISLGLMVSASVKNITQANSALPILLLPQIIFAGVLFKMENIQIGKMISGLMISRWSVGAYKIIVDINTIIPPPMNTTPAGGNYKLPLERITAYDANWPNLALNWGLLLLHATIYLAITYWLQKRKDAFKL